MKETLIGFDARLAKQAYVEQRWNAKIRSTYLLKINVTWPLAVDTGVWPSVFEKEEATGSTAQDFRREVIGLWSRLDDMSKVLRDNPTAKQKGATVIAVSVMTDETIDTNNRWGGMLEEPVAPISINPAWLLLGYDVADLDFISGLTNCGYNSEEKSSLTETWNGHLNKYGLFSAADEAQSFREATNIRVSEHSPFLVYGLYRVNNE